MPTWLRRAVWRASARERWGKAGAPLFSSFCNFMGTNPAQDLVFGLPDFTHAADRNTRGQLESAAEGDSRCRPHLFNTASKIFFAFGLVSCAPVVMSTPCMTTVTDTCGSFAGANPVNQELFRPSVPSSAVPVLPATSTPGTAAPAPMPWLTTLVIHSVIWLAISGV